MTKEIDPLKFVDEIFEQEKSDAAMRERDPGSEVTYFPAWCHHKDGKIVRPLIWRKPGIEEWSRQSIEFHERQRTEAGRFAEETEQRIRRERSSAGSKENEVSSGADLGNPASDKESRRPIELVIG